jgi:O-antigen/teichoic acid export membrane protein
MKALILLQALGATLGLGITYILYLNGNLEAIGDYYLCISIGNILSLMVSSGIAHAIIIEGNEYRSIGKNRFLEFAHFCWIRMMKRLAFVQIIVACIFWIGILPPNQIILADILCISVSLFKFMDSILRLENRYITATFINAVLLNMVIFIVSSLALLFSMDWMYTISLSIITVSFAVFGYVTLKLSSHNGCHEFKFSELDYFLLAATPLLQRNIYAPILATFSEPSILGIFRISMQANSVFPLMQRAIVSKYSNQFRKYFVSTRAFPLQLYLESTVIARTSLVLSVLATTIFLLILIHQTNNHTELVAITVFIAAGNAVTLYIGPLASALNSIERTRENLISQVLALSIFSVTAILLHQQSGIGLSAAIFASAVVRAYYLRRIKREYTNH